MQLCLAIGASRADKDVIIHAFIFYLTYFIFWSRQPGAVLYEFVDFPQDDMLQI